MKRTIACLLTLLLASFSCLSQTNADRRMLAKASPYFPAIKVYVGEVWATLDDPLLARTFVAAQIEQESLWNPRAELKTSREYGFGFGQFTVTNRFNAFNEIKAMHPRLASWTWEDRFNPDLQILAVVVKDAGLYRSCLPLMSNSYGGLACTGSSYNGGYGGFLTDRKLCSNTAGCNPRYWNGNIAVYSMKSRMKWQGYGKSAYDINREYVTNVLEVRRDKYINYLGVTP